MKIAVVFAAVAATVSLASAARADDYNLVIGPGVQTLPVSGPSGPIYAYDTPDTGTGFVSTAAPRNGNGSLEIHGDRARYVIGNMFRNDAFNPASASQALFSFNDLNTLTFDWQVATPSNGAGAHNTPAVRAHIIDGDVRAEMIWEGVYNGGTAGVAPAAGWQNAGADSTFYLNIREGAATFLANAGAGYSLANGTNGTLLLNGAQQNRVVGDWHSLFSSNAYVTGLSFGAGSGFGSNFVGFIDNVDVRSPNGNNFNVNFEAAAVPEPATWAMMLGGFGLVGAAMRRRSTKVVFA
ncbi:PEPxxWA-CTERM sorting domain-containing protein [Sphingomonas tabacisoli]|uniref:PEPxxWA-CTERM sorting domain-containing protein n=1 Tax=Sphingomonas tabacisoli TaxID=2249466 RepID=A0ABW4I360_9SPHN